MAAWCLANSISSGLSVFCVSGSGQTVLWAWRQSWCCVYTSLCFCRLALKGSGICLSPSLSSVSFKGCFHCKPDLTKEHSYILLQNERQAFPGCAVCLMTQGAVWMGVIRCLKTFQWLHSLLYCYWLELHQNKLSWSRPLIYLSKSLCSWHNSVRI